MMNVVSMTRLLENTITGLRIAELERMAWHRHGGRVPLDDADGWALAEAVLDHLAHVEHSHLQMFAWLMCRVGNIEPHEARMLVKETMARLPVFWRARDLGRHLGLTASERSALAIRTIRAAPGQSAAKGGWSARKAGDDPPPRAA